jgi:DNA-binding transcriptional LysR family regulator
LNVTPGAISQQLRKGEEQLGFQVFMRMQSGLEPTERGRQLLASLHAGFSRIQDGVIDAKGHGSATLTVSLGSVFAVNWLVPRLAAFRSKHPNISLRIETSRDLIDFRSSDVDLAIRLGAGRWPDVDARKLWDQSVFPICSPSFASRLTRLEDLSHVPIIIDSHSVFEWKDWLAEAGASTDFRLQGTEFNEPILAFGAVLAGHGVMLGWTILAADALAEGRLVKPFPCKIRSEYAYWLVWPRSRKPSPAARLFSTWLLEAIARIEISS